MVLTYIFQAYSFHNPNFFRCINQDKKYPAETGISRVKYSVCGHYPGFELFVFISLRIQTTDILRAVSFFLAFMIINNRYTPYYT